MTRRYTWVGGLVALTAAAVVVYLKAADPATPIWFVLLVAGVVGMVSGRLFFNQDLRQLRKIKSVVDAMSRGDLAARARIAEPGLVGSIARSLDALSERLSKLDKAQLAQDERLRTILDAMSEAVLVTDADGHITLSNRVLQNMLGMEVEGKTAVEAIRHPDFHEALQQARQGETSSLEFELARANPEPGPRRALRASVAPLRGRRGVVAVLYDVTQERATERVRRDFVANASHELRTPLTAIRGFAETLKQDTQSDPAARERFLDVILRHTKRLELLVDDLSHLSRLENEEALAERRLQPVDPGRLLAEVVEGLESRIRAKALSVQMSGTGAASQVLADPRSLEQICVNLVDNAIKYTPANGKIQISVTDRAEQVQIEVANTGPGIPEKHLSRVFERFYRVDAGRSRELGGTGLGLSIVKHLVANLGGEVSVQSVENDWTRFCVLLPRFLSSKADTLLSQS